MNWGVSDYTNKEDFNTAYSTARKEGKKEFLFNGERYNTDKELSQLDVNKKDFDTLGLQRELNNRGYKLPKSTKKDGNFDGILGDETKNALLKYKKITK
jgi:peptidoglycan hydrolase-like protein with peptidoglycan-binding domain